MSAARINDIIKELSLRIEPTLSQACFRRDANREWIREWGWKFDMIDVVSLNTGLLINLYVFVPTGGQGSREFDTLAMSGLGQIMGNQRVDFRLPGIGDDSSFVEQIALGLNRGLSWFEAFGTRLKCQEQLWNGTKVKDSPSYRNCEAYLQGLPRELDEPACLWPLDS